MDTSIKPKRKGGFNSMNPELKRKIQSMGGKAAHRYGTCHEWNSEEATIAASKGGSKGGHRWNSGTAKEASSKRGSLINQARNS